MLCGTGSLPSWLSSPTAITVATSAGLAFASMTWLGQQRDTCAAAARVSLAPVMGGAWAAIQSQRLFLGTFADVCSCVCPQPVCRVTQRQLNITVQKKESNWWERLTKQEKRPLFLAPDFDRWLDESDAEMELKEKVGPVGTCGLCCQLQSKGSCFLVHELVFFIYLELSGTPIVTPISHRSHVELVKQLKLYAGIRK